MNDNKTYDSTGAEDSWCTTESSGLDKRQYTAQLTIFADGSVLPPLLIFRGESKHVKLEEERRCNKRVIVKFQQKTWCDEKVMD